MCTVPENNLHISVSKAKDTFAHDLLYTYQNSTLCLKSSSIFLLYVDLSGCEAVNMVRMRVFQLIWRKKSTMEDGGNLSIQLFPHMDLKRMDEVVLP